MISRKRREYELLSIQFEEDVETIEAVLKKVSECSSAGDRFEALTRAQSDQLWTESAPELQHINDNASRDDAEEKALAAHGVLTESGRTALNQLIEQLLEAVATLAAMDDDAFEKHFVEAVAQDEAEFSGSRQRIAEEKDRWSLINSESAAADFEHWSKTTGWEVDEAVALWLGKEPEKAAEALKKLRGPGGSVFRDRFRRRRGYVEGAISVGDLHTPINRTEFIRWAKQLGIDPPRQLEGDAEEVQNDVDKKPLKKVSTRPRAHSQSLLSPEELAAENYDLKKQLIRLQSSNTNKNKKTLQILFALAWLSHRFNPHSEQKDIVQDICEALLKHFNWNIGDDTLRKRLKDVAQHLPPHVTEQLIAEAKQQKNELPNSGRAEPNSAPKRR